MPDRDGNGAQDPTINHAARRWTATGSPTRPTPWSAVV